MSDPVSSAPLAAVEAIYFNMQDKLNDMLDACKTRQERDEIFAQFVKARHNYDDCVDQQFQANDPALSKLVEQAGQSAAEIKAIDTSLCKIAEIVNLVATAAGYGAQIVKKIVPA